MLRILIVTDAWRPQVNGVVRTLDTVTSLLREGGDVVEVIGPDRFRSFPTPTYPEVRQAILPSRRLRALVDGSAPDAVHVATEGPLGWAMRRLCLQRSWPFTTSFHTKFPDYVHARLRIPPAWTWAVLRRFHAPSHAVLAATPSLAAELEARGFRAVVLWTRGVDLARFRPEPRDPFPGLPRPVFLYAGRVAPEKNISAFLRLDLPGSKVVVGDGPQRAELRRRFPAAHFTGYRLNGELAASYAGADVVVFPSLTDTFGLVLLEALACGSPVAAFPVTGPLDVVGTAPARAPVGALDWDLREACLRALDIDRTACRRHAQTYSWSACAARFHEVLAPIQRRALSS